jgi:hypothetical protein
MQVRPLLGVASAAWPALCILRPHAVVQFGMAFHDTNLASWQHGCLATIKRCSNRDLDLCTCLQVGAAAAVKLALNQLIASLTVGFSTSLGLLQKNDVDIEAFMAILRPSALYAPTFDKKLPRMLARDYANPNFPTKHLLKDVRLFEREASRSGLNTSALQGLAQVISSCVERGLDDTDYSAVHDSIIDP